MNCTFVTLQNAEKKKTLNNGLSELIWFVPIEPSQFIVTINQIGQVKNTLVTHFEK